MNPFWSVSLFWIASALFVVIALAFVLPPLLRRRSESKKPDRRDINIAVYRDQLKEMEAERANGLLSEEQFKIAKLELEARLAEDALLQEPVAEAPRSESRKLGYALGVLLPVAAFTLYFWLGNPTSLVAIATAGNAAQAQAQSAAGGHDIAKMLEKVEAKVRANPDDGPAWVMLARTYAAMDRWSDAARAFERATKLMPKEAAVLSGYAEALAILNDRTLKGKPMELVQKALELDPNDMKALELSAIQAFQEKNFVQAADYFGRLYRLLPADSQGSQYAQDILAGQKEAMRLSQSGVSGLDTIDQGKKEASPTAGATIQGRVDIAPALKSQLSGKEAVFLFARPGQSGPPLAAIRITADKLPLSFELNDSMSMIQGDGLSQHKVVMLFARVSKTGNPVPQPGDLEGMAANVKVGATGVKITIDHTHP